VVPGDATIGHMLLAQPGDKKDENLHLV